MYNAVITFMFILYLLWSGESETFLGEFKFKREKKTNKNK